MSVVLAAASGIAATMARVRVHDQNPPIPFAHGISLSLFAGGLDLRTREHRPKKAKETPVPLSARTQSAPLNPLPPVSPALVPVLVWVDGAEEEEVGRAVVG